MSLEGVIDICLRQSDMSGVSSELRRRIDNSVRLRAAVAFWTLRPGSLSANLADRLGRDGFVCVDFHKPTSLPALRELAALGANVHLHLEHPGLDLPAPSGMPNHLMHAKTMLFDLPDGLAELWVGSHNATSRALGGVNIELSLVVSLRQNAPLYREAEEFLCGVRGRCTGFDVENLDWYEWLQRDRVDSTKTVLYTAGDATVDLSGSLVTLFGDDASHMDGFPRPNKKFNVAVVQGHPDLQTVYAAKVIDLGLLPGADPVSGGVTFASRRHLFHFAGTIGVLGHASVPDPVKVARSAFFVTLELKNARQAGTYTVQPVAVSRFVEPIPNQSLRQVDDWFYKVEGLRKNAKLFSVPNEVPDAKPVRINLATLETWTNTSPVKKSVIRIGGNGAESDEDNE
jgi:hypothetical protein